jgi:predicted membrane-bound spermidine synthase
MSWFLAFFLASGFCSLVYQIVWLRLAMADFGVNTPFVSIVLSVFMAGLALGSWGGGRIARRISERPAVVGLRLYAAAELLIGVSGIVVAPVLGWGRSLLNSGGGSAWGSTGYYLASGAWITLALLPFCICMGSTFPLAMAAIRRAHRSQSTRSFSFLYVANVVGAMAGALISAFVLVEILGFRGTLGVAATVNFLIAVSALLLSRGGIWRESGTGTAKNQAGAMAVSERARDSHGAVRTNRFFLILLFTTGLVSLAMEVVWVRQFVPFQGPVVYAFATILAVYLGATAIGSRLYRAWVRRRAPDVEDLPWALLATLAGLCSLLPLWAADPRIHTSPHFLWQVTRVALGLCPFCGVLGFLTPMLIDHVAAGDPDRAGRAYALNTVGCIIGPLLAGFTMLPAVGERWTLVILSVPFFAGGFLGQPGLPLASRAGRPRAAARAWFWLPLGLSALLLLLTRDFETVFPERVVCRDHTATVIATGHGMQKQLLINGVGITSLTPITKMMVHLPMASLDHPPAKGLVLCFGMGTSVRSLLAWNVPTTAVELVPSVPGLFGFFHEGQADLLRSPLATIVIDDARRFLERSRETYDVIVIDPPPPVEAAASSLLYSKEFYASAAKRLAPAGILQQWIPGGEPIVISAVTRALKKSFPYVRAFSSVEGWGTHYLASRVPIPRRGAAQLAALLPASAAQDLLAWGPKRTATEQFQAVIEKEIPVQNLIRADRAAHVLSDDRPVNEYYFLRRYRK